MGKQFDVIVVGAGPAGSAAAMCLARAGKRVVCFERGEYPGAKNVSGGILYGPVLKRLLNGNMEGVPLERAITRHVMVVDGSESHFQVAFETTSDPGNNPGAYSILRRRFDSWLSGKAVDAGALLITEFLVDDLLLDNGCVTGVRVRHPQGRVTARLVILADGANSILVQKAGLNTKTRPDQTMLAVKETIKLPPGAIESRFNVGENGAAYLVMGNFTKGVGGGGFIYTNRDSISLGVACDMNDLAIKQTRIHDILDRLKKTPWCEGLIRDGVIKEYAAHLIPSYGAKDRPAGAGDGILLAGDAAGFTINNGFILRGMDLALASGMAAANTCLEALETKSLSRAALQRSYNTNLQAAHVTSDLHTFRKVKALFKQGAIYTAYPQIMNNVLKDIYRVEDAPQRRVVQLLRAQIRKTGQALPLLSNCFRFLRAL